SPRSDGRGRGPTRSRRALGDDRVGPLSADTGQPRPRSDPRARHRRDVTDRMKITRIEHVQLAMPAGRESDAVAFYETLLGIPQVAKPAHLAARGGCWFERDGVKIHLGVEADFRPARKAHPALQVEGLAQLLQRVRDAGV